MEKNVDDKFDRKEALSRAITQVESSRAGCKKEAEIWQAALSAAEALSRSKYGFIGELNSIGLFDTRALSDPGWDACRMPGSEATISIKDMEIRGIDRSTMREGKSRIVNGDEAINSHPDHVERPKEHPPLNAFLGVPLKQHGKVIGMIGLANKEGGYAAADQQAVESLGETIVKTIMAWRDQQGRN